MSATSDSCIVCGTFFISPYYQVKTCSEPCRRSRKETYNIWYQMHARCYDPTSSSYPDYGEEGIGVCEEWDDVGEFIVDMGYRPEGLQLDRIDGDGDYTPDNCRWVTRKVNQNNRRNTVYLTMQGVTKPLALWADEYGITPKQLNARRHRGWTDEEAITTPLGGNKNGCIKRSP